MTMFSYKSISSTPKAFNPKAFALTSIGIALLETNKELMEDKFVSAPDSAIKEFKSLRLKDDYASFNKALKVEMTALIEESKKIKAESLSGGNRIRALNQPRMLIMDFFTKLACATVDSMTILKDEHVTKNPKKNGVGSLSHLTVVEFKHDGNTWVYEVEDVAGDAKYKESINGIEYTDFSGDAPVIHNLLKIAAHTIANKALRDYFKREHVKNPQSLKKAEMIASIIGGDASDYLIVSNAFDDSSHLMNVPAIMKKDDAHIAIILKKMLLASEAEYRELVKIFHKKPLFH